MVNVLRLRFWKRRINLFLSNEFDFFLAPEVQHVYSKVFNHQEMGVAVGFCSMVNDYCDAIHGFERLE